MNNTDDMSSAGLADARPRILKAFVTHAPFDGWSSRALEAAIRDSGVDPDLGRLAFDGPGDVAAAYSAWCDARMIEAMEPAALQSMGIRDRITHAVCLRLDQASGEREAVRALMTFLSLPGNQMMSLRLLYRTVDSIWRAIGDRSTDFSFYTRRASLAGVVGATVLYWLSDDSPDYAGTRAFLDRRIADVMKIEKIKGRARKAASQFPDPLRILRNLRGRNAAGRV